MLVEYIKSLLPAIEHFHSLGYYIAFFAAFLETVIGVGLIIPGSAIILLMGALAAGGYFDLGDLIWFAVFGAVMGDNVNYYIGKKYGASLLTRGIWFIKAKHFQKGKKFFEEHGSKSIFFGRFLPSVKEIIPLVAGVVEMKRLPFMFWNLLGAIGWGLAWILPGYFFAQSLDVAKVWLTRAGLFLSILIGIFILFYLLKILIVKKGQELLTFIISVLRSIRVAIHQNKDVQKLANKHQKILKLIRQRIDTSTFFGLPLTVLAFAFVYVLFLFGGIVEDVVNLDLIVDIDVRIANLLVVFRSVIFTKGFVWITLLGSWPVAMVISGLTVSTLWIIKKRVYIIPFMLTIIGSEAFTYAGKLILHRVRPTAAHYVESTFAFPSGHATIAVALYGFITYLCVKYSTRWSHKINFLFAGLGLMSLIGFSRLFLGVHFISNVWGGDLVGAMWLIIGITLAEFYIHKNGKTDRLNLTKNRKFFLVVSSLIALGFYMIFALTYQLPSVLINNEGQDHVVSDLKMVLSTEQLKYTESLLSNRGEPINFIIIAQNDEQLVQAFHNAGWQLADPVNIVNLLKTGNAIVNKQPYPQAPITPEFWNSEVHDFGFEKPTPRNMVNERHHVRFWRTNYITETAARIYVGAASFDNGIKWGITHTISPDLDSEREFLFNDLKATNPLEAIVESTFSQPVLGQNFTGDAFFTDGHIYIITLP